MTAIIRVPGTSRVAGAPHISDLPFPRQNVRTWISGNGYISEDGEVNISALVDRNNVEFVYPSLSPAGQYGFQQYTENDIKTLLRNNVSTNGYGGPVSQIDSKFSVAILLKWADPPAGVNATIFNIIDPSASAPMIAIRKLANNMVSFVVRREQSDTANTVEVNPVLPDAEFSIIFLEIDYSENSITVEVDGLKTVAGMNTQTGGDPILPGNTIFEVGGRTATRFVGELSDLIWFDGELPGGARDKVKQYLMSKQKILNA